MCKRRDSIAAMDAAAERLTEACEAALRGPVAAPADPAHPTHSGTTKALRRALGELSVTPLDMANSLRKLNK